MTEAEWLTCEEPRPMLELVSEYASERKMRLFACGSCRRFPDLPTDTLLQEAIHAMEMLADGFLDETNRPRYNTFTHHGLICRLGSESGSSAAFRLAVWFDAVPLDWVCRDIFGNPFRPVAFDPAWQSETVVGLARGIYEDRAFERMPILGDALEEAGCDNPDVLAHCREPGEHVRGCWVVDLVLGKS